MPQSQNQPSYEELQAQLADLKHRVEVLTKEKAELNLVVETITAHSDLVEEELWQKVALVPGTAFGKSFDGFT